MKYIKSVISIIHNYFSSNKNELYFNMIYYFLIDLEKLEIQHVINPDIHLSYYSYMCSNNNGFQGNEDILLQFEEKMLKENKIIYERLDVYDGNNKYILVPYSVSGVQVNKNNHEFIGSLGVCKKINNIKIRNICFKNDILKETIHINPKSLINLESSNSNFDKIKISEVII